MVGGDDETAPIERAPGGRSVDARDRRPTDQDTPAEPRTQPQRPAISGNVATNGGRPALIRLRDRLAPRCRSQRVPLLGRRVEVAPGAVEGGGRRQGVTSRAVPATTLLYGTRGETDHGDAAVASSCPARPDMRFPESPWHDTGRVSAACRLGVRRHPASPPEWRAAGSVPPSELARARTLAGEKCREAGGASPPNG